MPDALLQRLDVEKRAEVWRRIANAKEQSLFVVEKQGVGIVGFSNLMPSRDDDATPTTAELAACYVTPSHWRSGWGRVLMRAALDQAEADGYSTMTLWVLENNPPARAFYEAEGFVLDGARKDEQMGGAVLPHVRYRRDLKH